MVMRFDLQVVISDAVMDAETGSTMRDLFVLHRENGYRATAEIDNEVTITLLTLLNA